MALDLNWSWCYADHYHSSCSSPFGGEHDEVLYSNNFFHFVGTQYTCKLEDYKHTGNATGCCIIDPFKNGKDIIQTRWHFHSFQVIQILGTFDPIHIGDDKVNMVHLSHQEIKFQRIGFCGAQVCRLPFPAEKKQSVLLSLPFPAEKSKVCCFQQYAVCRFQQSDKAQFSSIRGTAARFIYNVKELLYAVKSSCSGISTCAQPAEEMTVYWDCLIALRQIGALEKQAAGCRSLQPSEEQHQC